MEDNNEEIPEIKTKSINGVDITNLEIAKIGMIYDYLVLDRFQEYCSFFRLEKCFGPFFAKEPQNFFPEVFKEICGPKRKYISYGRLILAYTKWKSKSSTNDNFNKFMETVFNNIIVTQDQNIGKIIEGGRIFSTRNNRGRKVISKFSVITDEAKNKINGFHIQYDDVFDTILSPDKTKNNITLEMNFEPNGRNIRDRDGISHIGGKFSETKGYIKFLIFKCRSGKTFYIGDETEEEGEAIKCFLYGTSSCQLKSVRIEVIDEKLMYLEPKFQPSLRVNQKIKDFDSIDENFIKNNIVNGPLIFEENEIQNMSEEELEKSNSLIIPCINDDAFIDKKELEEPLSGKDFNQIYKSFIVQQKEKEEKEVDDLKKKLYEKTIMRKHLLRVYLRKFKVKENISILRTNKQPETKISQDKFLAKIKAYRKKMDKNIQEKKEELKKENEDNDSYWNDEEEKEWPQDESIEIEEKKEDKKEEEKKEDKKEEQKKEDDKKGEDKKEEDKKGEDKKEEDKKEEDKKEEEKKEDDIKEDKKEDKKVDKKEEDKREDKKEEIPVEEPKIEIKKDEINDEIKKGENEENVEPDKIVLRGKRKKLVKNKNNQKEKEEIKEDSNKNEIIIKEEQKIEDPKIEGPKLGEQIKDEGKVEIRKKKITKESEPKDQIIIEDIEEKDNGNTKTGEDGNKKGNQNPKQKAGKCFCIIF